MDNFAVLKGRVETLLFNPSNFATLNDEQKDALLSLNYDLRDSVKPLIIPECIKKRLMEIS